MDETAKKYHELVHAFLKARLLGEDTLLHVNALIDFHDKVCGEIQETSLWCQDNSSNDAALQKGYYVDVQSTEPEGRYDL